MIINKVTTASIAVEENIEGYDVSGVVTMKEDGTAESVQSGVIRKDGTTVMTFTSWNFPHLNFDCPDSREVIAYIDIAKTFCERFRAEKFTASASLVTE